MLWIRLVITGAIWWLFILMFVDRVGHLFGFELGVH